MKTKSVTIRLSPKMKNQLQEIAKTGHYRNSTISAVIFTAIYEFLDREKEKQK